MRSLLAAVAVATVDPGAATWAAADVCGDHVDAFVAWDGGVAISTVDRGGCLLRDGVASPLPDAPAALVPRAIGASCDGEAWAVDAGAIVAPWGTVEVDGVLAIACAGPGSAWIGTTTGVGHLDAAGWHPVLAARWADTLLSDGSRLWIGTPGGLWVVDGDEAVRVGTSDVRALLRVGSALFVGTPTGVQILALPDASGDRASAASKGGHAEAPRRGGAVPGAGG